MTDDSNSNAVPLEDGWRALRAGQWAAARTCFAAAVARQETPEALEGLSWAAWWLDEADALFEAREGAFRGYRKAGDAASAARMAAWLAADHLDFHGALAVAGGWLDRGRRLLEALDPTPDHGWLAFHRGFIADIRGQTSEAEADAVVAAELGRRFGVPDLEMLGLALQGMSLVSRAKVREGMRCLDEASAMALANEATIPISAAWTCCFLVTSCARVLDFDRAFEWCDRIAEFAERYGSRYMLGFCRAEYADVHLWRGEWPQAEQALEESIAAYRASRPAMAGGPTVLLAELRRRQGRPDESQRLLEGTASASAQLCRAHLELDRGAVGMAIDLGQRALRCAPDDRPLERVPALEFLARAQIAGGALEPAAASLRDLREIARLAGTRAMNARITLLEGMLAAAGGDHEAAKARLEDAVDTFEHCGAPYDAACARIELASTLAALGRATDAGTEAQRAHDTLRALGAVTDGERARRLTGAAGSGACSLPDTISRRERDVLQLLCQGLTNRKIAERLFISEHTVHRHVTSILRKLDVRSRAAAAALAVKAGLPGEQDQ